MGGIACQVGRGFDRRDRSSSRFLRADRSDTLVACTSAMSPNQQVEPESPAPDSASCRSLFDRVKAGPDLMRSPRLRQLFEYLYEKSVADPGLPLTEERIGVEVFGRSEGYDTGVDTIVRVQVSQLRKRLEHHFLSDGAHEPVIIEFPRRSYTPVFRLREMDVPEAKSVEPTKTPFPWKTVSVCLAALLALSGWLLAEHSDLGRRALAGAGGTPFRDHFWRQLFRGERQTQLITSDANAMVICDFLGRTLTPAEYVGSGYPDGLIDLQIQDPATRRVLKNIASNFVTNMPDLRVASRACS